MTVRVTHTPCQQPVDLSDDNRILTPDTDVPHHCPVTAGPYQVVHYWTRWSIQDVLDRDKPQPIYDTQHQAQTEADRRNRAHTDKHTRRPPTPAQPDLFSNQEATG